MVFIFFPIPVISSLAMLGQQMALLNAGVLEIIIRIIVFGLFLFLGDYQNFRITACLFESLKVVAAMLAIAWTINLMKSARTKD